MLVKRISVVGLLFCLFGASAKTDWRGYYVGVVGGYGLTSTDTTATATGADLKTEYGDQPLTISTGPSGGVLGVSYGRNLQNQQIVYGFETDLVISNISDLNSSNFYSKAASASVDFFSAEQSIPWLATARGRVGYAVDQHLFYVTAGLAALQNTTTTTLTANVAASGGSYNNGAADRVSTTSNIFGLVWGAGVESVLTKEFSFKAELLSFPSINVNYDSAIAPGLCPDAGGCSYSVSSKTNALVLFRMGFNYHFA